MHFHASLEELQHSGLKEQSFGSKAICLVQLHREEPDNPERRADWVSE